MKPGRNTPLPKSWNNLIYIRVALEPGGRFKVPAQLEALAANEPHHASAQPAADTVWRGDGPLDRSDPHRLYFVSCERSSCILAF
jgi:hypothetical protein